MKIKKKVMMLALACAAPLAAVGGTTIHSHAATNMGVEQTGSGESGVTIEWDSQMAVYGTDIHYHVYVSTDGKNWNDYDSGYFCDETDCEIKSLNPASNYYVKVTCYSGSGFDHRHYNEEVQTEQIVRVKTDCKEVENVKQTKATKKSVTLSWSKTEGAEYYNIYEKTGYNEYKYVKKSNTTSTTISGLKASTAKNYCVAAVRTSLNGFKAEGYVSDTVNAHTIPSAVKKVTCGITWLNDNRWDWTDVENEEGYQYEIRSVKGKKIYSKGFTSRTYTTLSPSETYGKFIKVRARAYVTVNGKKVYGSWSPYTYCANCKKVVASRSSNGKKISLRWAKISGATSYRIYISDDPDMGYKKVATVSGKKSSYVIKKYGRKNLKKGTTYYVRIKYVTKIGKKNYISQYYTQRTLY